MLSRTEWMSEAERSAARKFGEQNAGLFMFRRWLAGPMGVLALAGLLGAGLYWLWNRIGDALSGAGHLPGLPFWIAATVLLVITGIVFRPRPLPTPGVMLLFKASVMGLLWLGLLTYGFALWLF